MPERTALPPRHEGKAMESFERVRLDVYFAEIAAQFAPADRLTSFLITHLLPERPAFVRAVASMSRLRTVLPKPKSIHPAAQNEIEKTVPCDPSAVSCSPTPTPRWTTSNHAPPANRSR
jgi:hypothetical protein